MALDGKLVLVTGGGDGIGRAICQLFANEGARVVICDVDFQGAEDTLKSLHKKKESQNHMAVHTDVSDASAVEELAHKIAQSYQNETPSVVVCSAGIVPNMLGLEHETEETFDKVVAANLKGTFLINRKFALMMKERGIPGSFVNFSSINVHGWAPGPAYSATKGAIVSMTKSFAKELAKHGIRFNVVQPGAIDTRLPYKSNMPEEIMKAIDAGPSAAPLGRHGKAEEVAEVCLFLASDRSSYVTCSEYEVHGGLHAIMGDKVQK